MSRMAPRVADLVRQRVAFVHATVVRAESPTSAFPGDDAVILADGTIEGFVGGQCAEESVRQGAQDALREGTARLLRILPPSSPAFPDRPGAVQAVNHCLSGGALEIFLEPMMPAPTLCVIGETPVTAAIAKIGPLVGLNIMTAARGDEMDLSDVTAMVIGTHGHFEPESIRAALDATVPFIGLVASEKRGAGVLDAMGLTEKERARISTPVGVEIGAKGAEEIALSIVAGVVRALRIDNVSPRVASALPNAERGVDPICGMTVTIRPDAISAVKDGVTYWFCCAGCKETFLAA